MNKERERDGGGVDSFYAGDIIGLSRKEISQVTGDKRKIYF